MPVTLGLNQPPCAPRLRVYIADDIPAMREGLARLIGDECDMAVTNSAATATELRVIVADAPPDVLVMDLMLGDSDGLALIRDLLGLAPGLHLVVFTAQPKDIYASRCLQAGAQSFVGKRDAVSTLFRAIRDCADGRGMIVTPPEPSRKRTGKGSAAQLTDRELQVFRLVGQALATKVVAAKLGVSVKTVETHRENIKNKLQLSNHSELVARAAQWLRENEA